MKLKSKINGDKPASSHDKCNDNQTENQHQKLDDSLDDKCSTKKACNNKRKGRLSSQVVDNSSEQLNPKRKCKSKTDVGDETDFQMENEKYGLGESDKDDTHQDNTPKSLRKKKKFKKKKGANPVIAKPNDTFLDYLQKWKGDRSNWKFEKVKQIRLISNMFENEKLPDDYFSIFLDYMEGGSKSVKELMLKLANEVVDEMEKWESLSDGEKEATPKVNENKYERARTVLQMLQ